MSRARRLKKADKQFRTALVWFERFQKAIEAGIGPLEDLRDASAVLALRMRRLVRQYK